MKIAAAQMAGILCGDDRFKTFVGERLIGSGAVMGEAGCAEFVRRTCGVTSRADIDRQEDALAAFEALRTEFDAWTGKIARQR